MTTRHRMPTADDIMRTNGAIFDGIVPNAGTCPTCGSTLTIQVDGLWGSPEGEPEKWERVPTAFCCGCDFVVKLDVSFARLER